MPSFLLPLYFSLSILLEDPKPKPACPTRDSPSHREGFQSGHVLYVMHSSGTGTAAFCHLWRISSFLEDIDLKRDGLFLLSIFKHKFVAPNYSNPIHIIV